PALIFAKRRARCGSSSLALSLALFQTYPAARNSRWIVSRETRSPVRAARVSASAAQLHLVRHQLKARGDCLIIHKRFRWKRPERLCVFTYDGKLLRPPLISKLSHLPDLDCSVDTQAGAKQEIGNLGRLLSADIEQEDVKRQEISITTAPQFLQHPCLLVA